MQTFLAFATAIALAALLLRDWALARRRAQAFPDVIFSQVKPIFKNPVQSAGSAKGIWVLEGIYLGHSFQLKALVDTLPTRKLPSLWLLITLPEAQPVQATLDMMLRPAAATSFSNFDFLPHTLKTPEGFPPEAVIRTDAPQLCLPAAMLLKHIDLFRDAKGKELLISPKGLRIVVQVAEVDRARYVVLREARFDDTVIDAASTEQAMNVLLALSAELKHEHGR